MILRYIVGHNESARHFLLRTAFAAVLCISFLLLGQIEFYGPWVLPNQFLGIVTGVILLFIVGIKLNYIFTFRAQMRKELKRHYASPLEITSVSEHADAVRSDPAFRKFHADLLDLGAKHWLNFSVAHDANLCASVYFFPEDRVWFQFVLVTRAGEFTPFPLNIVLQLFTLFDVHQSITTSNTEGYRKNLHRDSLVRCFPGVTDPAELLQHHRELVSKYGNRYGEPLTLTPVELLARLRSDNQVEHQLRIRHGYFTLGDTLHEVFRITRSEYLSK